MPDRSKPTISGAPLNTERDLLTPAELARLLIHGTRARAASKLAARFREVARLLRQDATSAGRPRHAATLREAERLGEQVARQALLSLRTLHPRKAPRRRRKRDGQLDLPQEAGQ